MAKKKTVFKAGDKIRLSRPAPKKAPVTIGAGKATDYFPVSMNGVEGRVYYDRIYQVSGNDKVALVDNESKPIALVDKEFVNSPIFNTLFQRIKEVN